MTAATLMRMSSARFTVRVQVATFEAAEVWTNTVDDAAAGHFVEGSQGKKITGSPGYTQGQRTFGGVQDYSGMAASERFRMWAYIANLADAGFGNPTLAIRFAVTTGDAYYQMGWPYSALVNGGQYLYWRQADTSPAGPAPDWSNILSIRVLLYGAASTITATLDDLVIGS